MSKANQKLKQGPTCRVGSIVTFNLWEVMGQQNGGYERFYEGAVAKVKHY